MPSTEDRIRMAQMRYARPLIVDFNQPSTLKDRIAAAASETHRTPSEAQKRAGNYAKGKFWWNGREISIENPRGSVRSGVSKSGKPWSVRMAGHYGYVRRTLSEADGDAVDVFIGPHPESDLVCVVDQRNPDGDFDEHKAVLGCVSVQEAKQLYLDCYSPGWTGLKSITPMTRQQFFAWLDDGDTGKPIADQVSQYGRSGLNLSHDGNGDLERRLRRVLARYGKTKPAKEQSEFKWITLKSKDGGGGAHVQIDGKGNAAEQSTQYARRLNRVLMRYQQFDESKVKRDSEGKFSVQSGHIVPSGNHVDVAGRKYGPGEWIHSHQLSSLTPEQRKSHIESLSGRKLGDRSYRDEHGKELSAKDDAEIRKLKIRPDLKDVVVMRNEHSELKGYGTDSKGRRQPFYPSAHHERAKAAKVERIKQFNDQIRTIRNRIQSDMQSDKPAIREAAFLAYMIDKTGMRIGSDKDTGAEKKATGATTLENSQVKVHGSHVIMDFVGKSGHDNHWEIDDPVIADEMKRRLSSGKRRLFETDAPAFRKYMHEVAPGFKPAKDFRTAIANEHALNAIQSMPIPATAEAYREAIGKVASIVSQKINNTPKVSFDSYILPEVFGSWQADLLSKGIDVTGLTPSFAKTAAIPTEGPTKSRIERAATGISRMPRSEPRKAANRTAKIQKTTETDRASRMAGAMLGNPKAKKTESASFNPDEFERFSRIARACAGRPQFIRRRIATVNR